MPRPNKPFMTLKNLKSTSYIYHALANCRFEYGKHVINMIQTNISTLKPRGKKIIRKIWLSTLKIHFFYCSTEKLCAKLWPRPPLNLTPCLYGIERVIQYLKKTGPVQLNQEYCSIIWQLYLTMSESLQQRITKLPPEKEKKNEKTLKIKNRSLIASAQGS